MRLTTTVPNKLINEKSPYLQQHAYNPVDWHPWNEDTFELSRSEGKPIFLSIGYSTCYWCHVMEREVFENKEIAGKMNEYFVNVKVDREERPDIDRVYMTVLQAISGSGGWPMSIFLTPHLKPFYAATYIPPRAKYGRAGFEDVIEQIHKLWKTRKEEVEASGEKILLSIKDRISPDVKETQEKLSMSIFYGGIAQYEQMYDPEEGGFGKGNKFPRPASFEYLLNLYQTNKEFPALDMTLHSLKKMYDGGMYDHLGKGFHRYSVDPYWRVPHFEKMLYDQAQLISVYSHAYQITKNEFFLKVAKETADYVFERLQSDEGAFYSAEDAESAVDAATPEAKEEGAYYLWLKGEIDEILGSEASAIICHSYGVESHGNTIHDPHEVFGKKNVLYLSHDIHETAKKFEKTPAETEEILRLSKDKLLKARENRPAPFLDEKILATWNALAISGLCSLYNATGDDIYLQGSINAMSFLMEKMTSSDQKKIFHRYKDGETKNEGTLEDYAFVTAALIDLYECTFDFSYLDRALKFNETAVALFYDKANGGFFDADPRSAEIVLSTKDIYDGAEPSGNSIQISNLLRLGFMTDNNDFKEMAGKSLGYFADDLRRMSFSSPSMLCAMRMSLTPPTEVILTGKKEDEELRDTGKFVRAMYLPNSILINASEEMKGLFPFLKKITGSADEVKAFICRNHACSLPTSDKLKIGELLAE